jgi:hypothetical protein
MSLDCDAEGLEEVIAKVAPQIDKIVGFITEDGK